MIVNLPTSEALNATALKLYFRAWQGIVQILLDFDEAHQSPVDHWFEPVDDFYSDERSKYLEAAQEEFHSIASIAQQANELALKARIVAVSPYLLLLNNDVNLNHAAQSIEFATLRTLDAVDLPKAVNALTSTPVSEGYKQRYSQMRIQRNQYTHLGDTSATLEPIGMCGSLVEQYCELWPERSWLCDRVESTHGREHFFDGKHWSPRQEIMYLMEYDRGLIPAAGFRKLFGVKKADMKFGCFACQDDWAVSRNGPGIGEVRSSFYIGDKKVMHCVMCDSDAPAILKTCVSCDCKFAAPVDAKFGAGRCFMCGDEGENEEAAR